jgi:hypothetical protein
MAGSLRLQLTMKLFPSAFLMLSIVWSELPAALCLPQDTFSATKQALTPLGDADPIDSMDNGRNHRTLAFLPSTVHVRNLLCMTLQEKRMSL